VRGNQAVGAGGDGSAGHLGFGRGFGPCAKRCLSFCILGKESAIQVGGGGLVVIGSVWDSVGQRGEFRLLRSRESEDFRERYVAGKLQKRRVIWGI